MNKKKKIIIIFIILLIFMAIGFSLYKTNLNINSIGKINNFSVYISDLTFEEYDDGKSLFANILDNKISVALSTSLNNIGDKVDYLITVKNGGNVDAILDDYSINNDNNPNISFTYTLIDDIKLKPGEEYSFHIIVEYITKDEKTNVLDTESNSLLTMSFKAK